MDPKDVNSASDLAHIINVRNASLNKVIRKLILTLMVFSALVVVIGSINLIQLQNQNQEAAESRQNIREQTARIEDCIDPEGECAKANAKRLADAIQELNEYNRIALACATTLPPFNGTVDDNIKRIDACVKERISPPLPPGTGGG